MRSVQRSVLSSSVLSSSVRLIRAVGVLAACLAVPACVAPQGGWRGGDLDVSEAESGAVDRDRLSDALPFFAPDGDALRLFLCRWPTERPVRVSVAGVASDEERQVVSKALAAWEAAIPALRFEAVEQGAAELEIELRTPDETGRRESGNTVADCAVAASGEAAPILLRASIHLHRTRSARFGRTQPLSAAELLGSALHELGHALGFSGHVARGDSVMLQEMDAVRRWGSRVLGGQALREPALVRLYALPSGLEVGRLPLAPEAAAILGEAAARAGVSAVGTPLVRVGDRAARWAWHDAEGAWHGVSLADWPGVLAAGRVGVSDLRRWSARH